MEDRDILKIDCVCKTKDHSVILEYFIDTNIDDDGVEDASEFVITLHLARARTFFERLKIAFRYIFGLDHIEYNYIDTVISNDDLDKILSFIETYKKKKQRNNHD
jgi:hypothetical protein